MKISLAYCIASLASQVISRYAPLGPRDSGRPSLQYTPNYFEQRIDHFPGDCKATRHTNATFKQRYYVDSSYYKPGGPVFLYIGGETSGTNRFSNLQTGIIQILMEATNGLGVILENRYYGQSYPYNSSTTDDLIYLTTHQTIADNAHFAQHAKFPAVDGDLTAPGTPWILYGGSLAGAQTAFSIKEYGDVLYGGIASSAPVTSPVGYPAWYDPIQKYAPQDCVTRINRIIDNFDRLVSTGNAAAIREFKALFGLEALMDHRDFATTIAYPIGNPGFYPTNTWQELNWNASYGSSDFFTFCDSVTSVNAPESIAEVDYALANYTGGAPWAGLGGYADYVKRVVLPLCASGDYNSRDCFGTQDAAAWARAANSAERSYLYTSCTEQGAYIDAPKEGPSLLSRVVDTSYEQQWCRWAFPDGKFNKIPTEPDLSIYDHYGGFNISADRLAFIDGDQDVWNDLCYHSNFAPPRTESTDLRPQYLITGAGHHWDSSGILDVDAEPQFIREAHRWEIRTVKRWLNGFEQWKTSKSGTA
ncbi:extracelular serine carboxypeptidase-like protein [Apiospora hydei]|uniref:Extracelular serine carboxypeptidase-like protein n=1 Tax=Apiospora hydei TaxID=1337664 RepID=A0ABR1V419_9PEZI